MLTMQRFALTLTLVLLGLSVPISVLAATEEGGAESAGEIVLECAAGTVTKDLPFRETSVEATMPGCYCFDDPARLQGWLASLADMWLAGEPVPEPGGNLGLVVLEPGEQALMTFHCVSPGQIAEYREAVLAGGGD